MKLRFTPHAVQELTEPNLILFPRVGRRQTTEGVRKVVTRKYPYLIYYTVDDAADEIVILNVRHPARERDQSDV